MYLVKFKSTLELKNCLQVYNIKGYATVEEITESFNFKTINANDTCFLATEIIELDSETTFPVYFNYNTLAPRYSELISFTSSLLCNTSRAKGNNSRIISTLFCSQLELKPSMDSKLVCIPYSLLSIISSECSQLISIIQFISSVLGLGFSKDQILEILEKLQNKGLIEPLSNNTKKIISSVLKISAMVIEGRN